jgi:hypothetical protein
VFEYGKGKKSMNFLQDMKAELKPREQKAYVRGKMQDVATDNNASILLSSDTEMEEGEEQEEEKEEVPVQNREEKKDSVEKEEKEVEEQLFGTPTLSRKSSSTGSGSVSKTEPGKNY